MPIFSKKKEVAKPMTAPNLQNRIKQIKTVNEKRKKTLDLIDEDLGMPKPKKKAVKPGK
jgi:hypothetical protein